MNYDNWKLSNPIDDYATLNVTSCCGAPYDEKTDEDGYEYYVCLSCNDEADIIDDYEYLESRRLEYKEWEQDEKKLNL